jgi:hypothetical protein
MRTVVKGQVVYKRIPFRFGDGGNALKLTVTKVGTKWVQFGPAWPAQLKEVMTEENGWFSSPEAIDRYVAQLLSNAQDIALFKKLGKLTPPDLNNLSQSERAEAREAAKKVLTLCAPYQGFEVGGFVKFRPSLGAFLYTTKNLRNLALGEVKGKLKVLAFDITSDNILVLVLTVGDSKKRYYASASDFYPC